MVYKISLEDRRTRGVVIYTYRLINGWEGVDYGKFFSLEVTTIIFEAIAKRLLKLI